MTRKKSSLSEKSLQTIRAQERSIFRPDDSAIYIYRHKGRVCKVPVTIVHVTYDPTVSSSDRKGKSVLASVSYEVQSAQGGMMTVPHSSLIRDNALDRIVEALEEAAASELSDQL